MSQPISALYFGHSQSERRIGLDLSAGPGFTVCEHRSGPSLTECTEGNSVTRLMAPLIRAIFTPLIPSHCYKDTPSSQHAQCQQSPATNTRCNTHNAGVNMSDISKTTGPASRRGWQRARLAADEAGSGRGWQRRPVTARLAVKYNYHPPTK